MANRVIGVDFGNSFSYFIISSKDGKGYYDFVNHLSRDANTNFVETINLNNKMVNLGIPSQVSVDKDLTWHIGHESVVFKDAHPNLPSNTTTGLKRALRNCSLTNDNRELVNNAECDWEIATNTGSRTIRCVDVLDRFFCSIFDKIIEYYGNSLGNEDTYYVAVGMPAREDDNYSIKISLELKKCLFNSLRKKHLLTEDNYIDCNKIFVKTGYEPNFAFQATGNISIPNPNDKLLIVDCGGGTTDFAIMSDIDGVLTSDFSNDNINSQLSQEHAGNKLDRYIIELFEDNIYKRDDYEAGVEYYNGYDSTKTKINDVVNFKFGYNTWSDGIRKTTTGSRNNECDATVFLEIDKNDMTRVIDNWMQAIIRNIKIIQRNYPGIKYILFVGASMNIRYVRETIAAKTSLTSIWTADKYAKNSQFLSLCVAQGAFNYANRNYNQPRFGMSIPDRPVRAPREFDLYMVFSDDNGTTTKAIRFNERLTRTQFFTYRGSKFIPVARIAYMDRDGYVVPGGRAVIKYKSENGGSVYCDLTMGNAAAVQRMTEDDANNYGYIVKVSCYDYSYCCIHINTWNSIKTNPDWETNLSWTTRPIN